MSGPGFLLRIDGTPVGWARTLVNHRQRRHFKAPKTARGQADVLLAWIAAGSPRLPDGPVAMTIEVTLRRPKSHRKRDGSLSAAGLRSPLPMKKPDVDNVNKLVADALNGRAYHDDAHITSAHTFKRWADADEPESTVVYVRPALSVRLPARAVALLAA